MKEIKLTKGRVALVDDEDYESVVSEGSWCLTGDGKYAYRRINGKPKTLHRFLMSPGQGIYVDHRNGDGLDCRRSNLRLATPGQNNENRGIQSNNACGYKGVTATKHGYRWRAILRTKGRRIHLGYFDSKEEAARAYDEAAKKYHAEFAQLNFPVSL